MFCRFCGKDIGNDAKFCRHCGKELSSCKPDAPSNSFEKAVRGIAMLLNTDNNTKNTATGVGSSEQNNRFSFSDLADTCEKPSGRPIDDTDKAYRNVMSAFEVKPSVMTSTLPQTPRRKTYSGVERDYSAQAAARCAAGRIPRNAVSSSVGTPVQTGSRWTCTWSYTIEY